MENYYNYRFELKHDQGTFFLGVISYSLKSAKKLIMSAENCPERAITYIRKIPITL